MADIGTPILGLPTVTLLDGSEWIPLVQGGTTKRAQSASLNFLNYIFPAGIDYVISANAVVPAGVHATGLQVPFDCTISGAVLNGDSNVGSAVVDIWKCTEADYDGGITHPVVADSITGGNPLTITVDSKTTSTLIGWTTTLTTGDVLWYNVNSCAVFTAITVAFKVTRSLP